MELCAATVRKHVLLANGDRRWDAFAHGWRVAGSDIEGWYRTSYDLSAAVFEDNEVAVARANLTMRFPGHSFGRLSHTLSMTRVASLALAREAARARVDSTIDISRRIWQFCPQVLPPRNYLTPWPS